MAKPWKTKNLNPTGTLSSNVAKVMRTKYQEMFHYLKGCKEGNADAIHDMRVASRRLITLLEVFKCVFSPREYTIYHKHVRMTVKALGKVRDYDVLLDMLRKDRKGLTRSERMVVNVEIRRLEKRRTRRMTDLKKQLTHVKKMRATKGFNAFLKKDRP